MIKFLLCCIETDHSASDVRFSQNVTYSSANVKKSGYSEAYEYIHVRTPEPDYATVAAGNVQNLHFFLNNLIFIPHQSMIEVDLCDFCLGLGTYKAVQASVKLYFMFL